MHVFAFVHRRPTVDAHLDDFLADVEIDDRALAEIFDEIDLGRNAALAQLQCARTHAQGDGTVRYTSAREWQRDPGDGERTAVELRGNEIHRRAADERRDRDIGGVGEDFGGRADLHDPAFDEHRHAIGNGHRLLLVVRDVHRRHAQGALQLAQLDACLQAQLGIEVRQRLVEQEEPRLAHDRACQRTALLLAARQLSRLAVEQMLDVHACRGITHGARRLVARGADHAQRKADVLGHAHVRVERVALEHHGDVALAGFLRCHVDAVQKHLACIVRLEAGENAQRCGLARP